MICRCEMIIIYFRLTCTIGRYQRRPSQIHRPLKRTLVVLVRDALRGTLRGDDKCALDRAFARASTDSTCSNQGTQALMLRSASLAIKVGSQPSAVNGKSAILTFRPFERTGADDEIGALMAANATTCTAKPKQRLRVPGYQPLT
jgi:hypothetical protein